MRERRRISFALLSLPAALLWGLLIWSCGDSGTGPSEAAELEKSVVLVTEPVPVDLWAPLSASDGTAASFLDWSGLGYENVSFVSYAPGSFPPLADSIEIHNLTSDIIVGAPMVNGGLDPIAVPTSVGDSLQITVTGLSGTYVVERIVRAVPAEEPPVVVRTDPGRRRTKVPLNARVAIVFSEPIDASTVNTRTIRLLDGDEQISSTIRLSDDRLLVYLAPDQLLELGTTYTVSVTEGVSDFSGSNLPGAFTSEFTTTEEVGSIHIRTETSNAGNMLPKGYVIVLDGIPRPHMGLRDTLTLTNVTVGMREIWIEDLHPHCRYTGPVVKYVRVRRNETASVYFDVSCTPGILHALFILTGSGFPNGFPDDFFQISVDGSYESRILHDVYGNSTFYGIELGPRRLEVTNLPPNCTFIGENLRTVTIFEGIPATTTWNVHCVR